MDTDAEPECEPGPESSRPSVFLRPRVIGYACIAPIVASPILMMAGQEWSFWIIPAMAILTGVVFTIGGIAGDARPVVKVMQLLSSVSLAAFGVLLIPILQPGFGELDPGRSYDVVGLLFFTYLIAGTLAPALNALYSRATRRGEELSHDSRE